MSLIAGVDVGGTNISAALVDERHRVTARVRVPTPSGGPAAVVEAIAETVSKLGQDVAAVGAGVPGPVVDGVVTTAPNLAGFGEPVPVAALLRERLGRPVAVGNDANLGTLGEWVAGAAKGARFVLGVWLGTGVGGGLILDGMPYLGASGGAGEFGHMCVRQGGALCGCGRRGCIEAYAGRACMEHTVQVAAAAGHETVLLDLARRREAARLTSGVWARALAQGDPLATRVFGEAVEALGAGVGAAVNLLDLDLVVLGGGLTEKLGQPLADQVATAAHPYLLVPKAERFVVAARLGDDSGVIGAAAFARSCIQIQ
ncbi:MAG: ROK family protein [Egibacteraceae bacterium]